MKTLTQKTFQVHLCLLIISLFLLGCTKDPVDPINGIDGLNGFNALVTIENEPAGDNCTSGGMKISVGQDDNDNGLLDETEIESISFVCNGNDGTGGNNGFPLVARTSPENPGANCENGGTLVEIGTDLNGNISLDDNEVQTSFYVCNGTDGSGSDGTDGVTTLITSTPENQGTNCSNGGLKIEIGLDTNNNNSLDEEEIASTYYVCNGENGSNGTDGFNSLVSITTETPGTNCSNGGLRIEVGLDSNSNGVLDEGEIIGSAQYVCNGSNGSDGNSPIVTTTPAPSECANGGIEVTIGFDEDGDGAIDSILEAFTICNGVDGSNGSDGFNTIISAVQEDPGSNCTSGGIAFTVGLDSNRNNTIDEDEEIGTYYVCNGTDGSNGSNGNNSLISVASFSGSQGGCTNGGFIIRTGIDDNSDGILDIPGEVDATSYVCNGTDGSNGNSDNIYEFYFANGFDGYNEAIDVSINDDGNESANDEYGEILSVDYYRINSSNSILYFPKLQEIINDGVNGDSFELVEAIIYLRSQVPIDASAPDSENWIGVKTLSSDAPLVVDNQANWYAADGSDEVWKSPGAAVTEAGGANGFSDQFGLPSGFFFDGYVPLRLNRSEITDWLLDENLNKGMILTMAQSNTYEIDFYSSEYSGDKYFRPTLYIKVKTNTRSRSEVITEETYKSIWDSKSYEEKIEPILRRKR